MTAETVMALLAALTQAGFGMAAWRLATKIDKRQTEHETTDNKFQADVRDHLGMARLGN